MWNDTGLTTDPDKLSLNGTVKCTSTHLTSFAILLSPTGDVPEATALSIVSYVGCAISILSLIATIVFFLVFR